MLIGSFFKPTIPPPTPSSVLTSLTDGLGKLLGSSQSPQTATGNAARLDLSPQAAATPAPEIAVAAAAAPAAAGATVPVDGAGQTGAGTAAPAAGTLSTVPPSLAPQPFANRTVGAEEKAEPARSQQALVPPGPDAEALFRSWAIAAQAKEMAQDVVKRIAAIDGPAWPAEATAEPKAAVPRTLATA